MKPAPRLFLDASVLIAAAASKKGGSALILELGLSRKIKIVSSRIVLLEAERNIKKKLGQASLVRFYEEIASLDIELVDPPTIKEIENQRETIDPKDAHVLAAALKTPIDFLLTLDRKHFFSIIIVPRSSNGDRFIFRLAEP